MKRQWEAVEIFINNEPNHIVVKHAGWKGRVIADCGIACPSNRADAELIARALNSLEA